MSNISEIARVCVLNPLPLALGGISILIGIGAFLLLIFKAARHLIRKVRPPVSIEGESKEKKKTIIILFLLFVLGFYIPPLFSEIWPDTTCGRTRGLH